MTDTAYGVRPRGYRLPDETRLGRVSLQVGDLGRSLEWYDRVFGMDVLTRGDGRAELCPRGTGDVLVELVEKRGARAVPRRGLLGLYHYALLLPDRAALGRFIAHLSRIGLAAGMSDHLVSEAVYITDPDGLGIEVYRDRPRSEWRVEDGQIAMATDHLDAQAVVASAEGTDWTGMPAGSVLGHVHLYVGDIERAAAFYHDRVGFDKVVWGYPGALFLSAGGYHHHLGTNIWAARSPAATDEDARLLEWEIIVPSASDVAAASSSLAATGAASESGDVVARDPWGTQLRIRAR